MTSALPISYHNKQQKLFARYIKPAGSNFANWISGGYGKESFDVKLKFFRIVLYNGIFREMKCLLMLEFQLEEIKWTEVSRRISSVPQTKHITIFQWLKQTIKKY